MKTVNQIRMDYQAMLRKADRLDELVKEIRNIVNNDVEAISYSTYYWTGESGDEFRQKVKKLENNLNKRAKDLENSAKSIRRTAQQQYKLEMTLVSLVSK